MRILLEITKLVMLLIPYLILSIVMGLLYLIFPKSMSQVDRDYQNFLDDFE